MLSILNPTRVLTGVILCVLALTACSPPGHRALFKGQAALEKGHYKEAVQYFQTATSILRTNAQAWNYLGLAHQHAGDLAAAERAYLTALQHDRDLSEARYNLGCLFLEQNRLENARSELTAFTLRRPNVPAGWVTLAAIQTRMREPVAAEKSYLEALKYEPNNPETWNALGLVHLQRNRPLDSRKAFESALKAQPGYAPALLNLAILAQQHLRDRQLALAKYRQYVALKPAPPRLTEVQEIIRQLEVELAPTPVQVAQVASKPAPVAPQPAPSTRTNLASNAAPAAKPVATSGPLVTAPAVAPKPALTNTTVSKVSTTAPSPGANAPKAAAPASSPTPSITTEVVHLPDDIVIRPGQEVSVSKTTPSISNARPEAAPIISSNPPAVTNATRPPRRGLFTILFPEKKQTAESDTTQAAAAAPAPADTVVVAPRYVYKSPAKPKAGNHAAAERSFAQGVQAQQAQKLNEAIQAYRGATQNDPAYFDAYYNLGVVASKAGNLQTALQAYEYALAIRPAALDARYNFALLLRQVGFPQDAANEHHTILKTYPNESRVHLALGNLYAQQLNQPTKARFHYQKVLEIDPQNPQAAAIRYWLTAN
jgi:tetratricopeptide (TPR) repeat protein